MKVVLLTRSNEDNLQIKNHLPEKEFSVFSCPLLSYTDLPFDASILKNYTDVIITSKRAARIVEEALKPSGFQGLNFWVVGENSKLILLKHKANLTYATKNVADLSSHLPKTALDKFIYLSGSEITMELPVKREIVYNVKYTKHLPTDVLDLFDKGIDYIMLYSQNCAKTLVDLLVRYELLKKLENTTVIAISSKVASRLNGYCNRIICCDDDHYDTNKMVKILIDDASTKR
jgi:uroporphyrinogen-III synthase